jgi:hypothetical protein
VFSPALYLELRRVISSLVVGICRSFRITAFGTYLGTSVIRRFGTYHVASIRRRAFDCKRSIISMFEVEAVSHSPGAVTYSPVTRQF